MGVNAHYFNESRIHEWSRVYNCAMYVRVLRAVSERQLVNQTGLLKRLKRLLDAVGEEATSAGRERYRRLLWTAAQYEYLFRDAVWTSEAWPITTRDEPAGHTAPTGDDADGR